MKVIIAGSRTASKEQVERALSDSGISAKIKVVVCGCAVGADTHGKYWGLRCGLSVHDFPADWKQFGRSAGIVRNREMARYADAAIVVWNGTSPSSMNMIDEMAKLNKPCFVFLTAQNAGAWRNPNEFCRD